MREEMEHQRRALEEIAERRHGHDEGGVMDLSDSDEEAAALTNPVHSGDLWHACSKDNDMEDEPSSDDEDIDNTIFYNLLGMS
ncbi:putative WRKY transcription factor 35 [Hordeum vulgare]|nr:putative WRKY transcription factor 35 [Hordeum vulgare]